MFLHESVHMVEKLRRGIIDFICFFVKIGTLANFRGIM